MFKGKALYKPEGKAGEYSQWGINFFNGCSGRCDYCYNKRFPILSMPRPTLKVALQNEQTAFEIVTKEILLNRDEIVRDGGVFLSFVSDPCLTETFPLTARTIAFCINEGIPIKILTKQTNWALNEFSVTFGTFRKLNEALEKSRDMKRGVAFGFTLTGHDEMEPGCAPNENRIKAMETLHKMGYRTWASIEPVIDYPSSLEMIRQCAPFCDHFKIGVRTDEKFKTTVNKTVDFINTVRSLVMGTQKTIYWKQSIRDIIGGGFPIGYNFVEEGYNMFKYR